MLPKGMEPPNSEVIQPPVQVRLWHHNYAALIYGALQKLPIQVNVEKMVVLDGDSISPEVQLVIRILYEKEVKVGDYK